MKKIGILFLISALVLMQAVSINALENVEPTPTTTATAIVTATAEPTPSITPSITPTPDLDTPTPNVGTPSPTPDGETPSPTPDGETPSPTPDGSPSASPSDTPSTSPTATAKPTVRPVISERTKDPYSREWETQAPPTLPPEVTVNPEEIATPVAGETTEETTPEPYVNEEANSVNWFLIVCLVLMLILIVDLYLIYWRKRMGYGTMINNGISRRKVMDLCDCPEEALPSDLEQAIEEDAKKEDENKEE